MQTEPYGGGARGQSEIALKPTAYKRRFIHGPQLARSGGERSIGHLRTETHLQEMLWENSLIVYALWEHKGGQERVEK